MTICPHARRMDLPCPYLDCFASIGASAIERILWPAGVYRNAQEALLCREMPRRERFVLQGRMVSVSGKQSIQWRWEQAA